MMGQIPLSKMKRPELIGMYNELAAERGAPVIQRFKGGDVYLVERIAIMRTYKPITLPEVQEAVLKRRQQPIRDSMLKHICTVQYYEHATTRDRLTEDQAAQLKPCETRSVGLTYDECLKRVLAEHPHSKVSTNALRVEASSVRQVKPGYEGHVLPQIRPRTIKTRKRKGK